MRVHITLQNTEGDYLLFPLNRNPKRYLQDNSKNKITRKEAVILTDMQRDEELLRQDPDALVKQLINGDPDIDVEIAGKFIGRKKRIFVDREFRPVYNYETIDALNKSDGTTLERAHVTRSANIFVETPLVLTERFKDPKSLALQFIFSKHYYIRHYNGVTFEFLYNLAEQLQELGKFQQLQAYDSETGRSTPIIISTGGSIYARAYLEGRVRNNEYCLILHLSDREFLLESKINSTGGN